MRSVEESKIQLLMALAGSMVMPVGLPPSEVMVQEPTNEPPTVYWKTLSGELLLTTQMLVPSVTRSVASALLLFRLKLLAAV
jgi:hypothetical protein